MSSLPLHDLGTPSPRVRSAGPLRGGMVASIVVHLSLVAALVVWGGSTELHRPPIYRVELVGAPPGPRQAGVVKAAAEKPIASKADIAGAERPAPTEKAMPTKKAPVPAPKATPSTERTRDVGAKTAAPAATRATAAPQAGAGAQGGKGADVANVSTRGIEFPYPGYLNNITRKIALNWKPGRTSAALVAEVKFVIRRDGSVAGIEVVRSSGDRLYDADGTGSIEAVGVTRGFGPLPAGYPDDVLVVYFTFDYALRP
jgi:protein TonB